MLPKILPKFGFASISKSTFEWITKKFPDGSTMLEFGSGNATSEFVKHYKVYSIEHNEYFVGQHPTNYIHAPIKDYGEYSWYDIDIIKAEMPKKYDFMLVDGPPKKIGREGFLHNIDMFDTSVPMIFDDVNREDELDLVRRVSEKIGVPYKVMKTSLRKKIAVISPEFA